MYRTAIVAAAAMALSGASVCLASESGSAKSVVSESNKAHAMSVAESPDAAFPRLAANIAQDAVTPGDMNHLIGQFSMRGQAEITQSSGFSENYGDKLDSQIRELSRNWKEKYGNEFTMQKAEQAFSAPFATVNKSEIHRHAVTLTVKGYGGLPEIQAPLVYQSTGWRLKAPKGLTAEKVRENLSAQISEFNQDKASWPANETEAYRELGDRALMAALDIPAPKNQHAEATPRASHKQVTEVTARPTLAVKSSATVRTISTTSHHWWQFWNW